ncbi:MAG: hypothetical protein HYW65_01045 [Candidatus Liptonbacteria bacterium]|nr:hypothetical protein [Candidatus Liptonbacteria bacterium]
MRRLDWKYGAALLGCLAVRLLPWRAPNVEPILATAMPFAKRGGAMSGFLFGAASIFLFDIVTGTAGVWSLITASSYGLVGAGAYLFLRNRESSRASYFAYAIIGTLVYDALTGLTVGPLFFGQSFVAAVAGQIPFTMLHLLGNTVFAVTVSPLVYAWITSEERRTSSDVAVIGVQ